jgi:SAM-dependent methyltransferase
MSAPERDVREPDPWWVEAFRADYLTVYPHRDLESARQEVAHLVEQGVRGRVLDLCCGFGRHALALRKRGADVFGLDLSPDLLARARELPDGELLHDRLVRADARAIPFASGCFDALVNLFSSFGYFGDDGDARVLSEIARVLRPGGLAVLDLMNPERIRDGIVPESRTERDGVVLNEHRRLEDGGRRVVKDVVLRLDGGAARSWRESVRLYDARELETLALHRGLALLGVQGDFDGSALRPQSPRQMLRFSKRG